MKQLYVVYLGFNSKQRCAEDHEVLFILSDKWIDDIKEKIKEKTSLPLWVHVDFLIKVMTVDWYDVYYEKETWEKYEHQQKLFFWYMWWESKDRFIEDHEMCFTIKENVVDAKASLKEKTITTVEVHVDFMKDLSDLEWYNLILKEKKEKSDNIEKVQGYSVL